MGYKYGDLTREIIGCAMRVHAFLGGGYQELIYQRCLSIELNNSEISHVREQEMDIFYRGIHVGKRRVDFFIEDKVMVEIKAVVELNDCHLAQGLNYLQVYNLEVGLLINFGAKSLQFKRLINQKYRRR